MQKVRKHGESGVKRASQPSSGPLYDAKCTLQSEVWQGIKFSSAMEEGRRVQRRETLFRANSHLPFRIPQKREKSKCTHLHVNGVLVTITTPTDVDPALPESCQITRRE